MLVLSRKPGESILIGSSKVTVVDMRSGRVRLGIEAQPEIPIVRTELAPLPADDERADDVGGES